VQWHAESLADRPEHGALFSALVHAAAHGDERSLRLAA
jgi:gamma-glutamyl-gamma-aminobutyrate hydrolase PuuD